MTLVLPEFCLKPFYSLSVSFIFHSLAHSYPDPSSLLLSAHLLFRARTQSFNESFEDQYNAQRRYAVPDSDLRSQLRTANVQHIVPAYAAFQKVGVVAWEIPWSCLDAFGFFS